MSGPARFSIVDTRVVDTKSYQQLFILLRFLFSSYLNKSSKKVHIMAMRRDSIFCIKIENGAYWEKNPQMISKVKEFRSPSIFNASKPQTMILMFSSKSFSSR